MLMVGALQCRNSGSASSDAYNDFVAHQRNVLDSNGYVLKGHFLRENGVQSGRAAYDEYSTALSNRHSGRSDQPAFCQTIASYTQLAATVSDHDFVVLAEAVIEPPVSSCTAAAIAAPAVAPPRRIERIPALAVATEGEPADPYNGVLVARPAAEPAAFPAVAYAAEPALADAPPAAVEVAQPAALPVAAPPVVREPVAQPVAARMPTTVIAAAPVVPPLEARVPSATDALQAAITALQAATDALKAQQAHPTS